MTKDSFNAKLAFYLSLGFWIPLFNIAICIVSIIIASKALRDYFKNPEKYGGLAYIILALIFSIASIVLSIVGLLIYLSSEDICGSAVCQGLTL